MHFISGIQLANLVCSVKPLHLLILLQSCLLPSYFRSMQRMLQILPFPKLSKQPFFLKHKKFRLQNFPQTEFFTDTIKTTASHPDTLLHQILPFPKLSKQPFFLKHKKFRLQNFPQTEFFTDTIKTTASHPDTLLQPSAPSTLSNRQNAPLPLYPD